ncbi:ParB-like nuclease domain protein [Microbacterium phage Gingerbug]|nr:ParB-like nuclease domain protein [Microbacterium phage Gingerbug]
MADSTPLVADLGTPVVVPITALKPSKNNPRRIPARAVEIVARSLREFGWQQALVADSNGVLLAGHTRLQAAKTLGLKHVPVIYAESLTPEQARAYRIADNRTGDFTSWDFPELARELEAIGDEFAEVLGLADWQAIMDDFENAGTEEDDEAVAAAGGSSGFDVVVTFETKDEALAASEALFDLGAVDVRHKRG